VTPKDPNITKVELIARALGPLREQVVFVGGCAVGLLITDAAASPVRVTFDVDLVASVSALAGYHGMEKELARLGFKRDLAPDAPICRWRYRELEVDLMPADPNILGFSNRWYPLALTTGGASANRRRKVASYRAFARVALVSSAAPRSRGSHACPASSRGSRRCRPGSARCDVSSPRRAMERPGRRGRLGERWCR
jgi:hypothetical protein